jgi:Ca2+-binding RTX toxin-like protein
MATTPTVWQAQVLSGPTVADQVMPEIVGLSNGNFVVVYADDGNNVDGAPGRDIVVALYDPLGQLISRTAPTNFVSHDEDMPTIVATANGGFAIAYVDDDFAGIGRGPGSAIIVERYDASGSRTMFQTIVTDGGGITYDDPTLAALPDDTLVVGYERYITATLTRELYARTISPANIVGVEYSVFAGLAAGQSARDPDSTTLTNGNVVTALITDSAAAGFDPYFMIRTSSGGIVASGSLSTPAGSASNATVVALTGGNFAVSWQVALDLFCEIRSPTGALVSASDIVIAPTALIPYHTLVALQDGGFFAIWLDNVLNFLQGQRYDATGNIVGSQINLPAPANPDIGRVHASLTSDGRILVAFENLAAAGYDVYHTILDPRGDTITGGIGADVIVARLEGGTIIPGTGEDTIEGQDGSDIIDLSGNDAAVDVVRARGGADRIIMDDTAANNIEDIDGGGGSDTFEWAGAVNRIVNLDTGQLTLMDGTLRTTFTDIENAHLSANSNSSVIGNGSANLIQASAGANALSGKGGNDTIFGGGGNDTLDGGLGDDTLDGGIGDDVYVVDSLADNVVESLLEGTDEVQTALASYALAAHVEKLTGTSAVGQALTGTAGDNTITGGVGDDFIDGGLGNDSIAGGAGFDYASYLGSGSGVSVSLPAGTATGGMGADTLLDIEGIYGSGYADTLTGSNAPVNAIYGWGGADEIAGGDGFDYVEAGEGNDTLDGGAGDDYLLGGNGADTLTFAASTAAIYVDMSGVAAFANGTATGFDVLSSVERIIGSAFEDFIFGSAGADTLSGGGGSDVIFGFGLGDSISGGGDTDYLVGGTGADTITTGLGQDYIYFQGQGEGTDTVLDWRANGYDIICIDEPSFNAGLTVNQYLSGPGNSGRFVAGTTATAAQGQFLWNSATSTLSWDADGTGNGAAVQLVILTGITSLSASDILVL